MATRWLVPSQWTVEKEFGVQFYLSAKVSPPEVQLQQLYLIVNPDFISWN